MPCMASLCAVMVYELEKQRRLQEVGLLLLVWIESYLIEEAWALKSYFLETHKRK